MPSRIKEIIAEKERKAWFCLVLRGLARSVTLLLCYLLEDAEEFCSRGDKEYF